MAKFEATTIGKARKASGLDRMELEFFDPSGDKMTISLPLEIWVDALGTLNQVVQHLVQKTVTSTEPSLGEGPQVVAARLQSATVSISYLGESVILTLNKGTKLETSYALEPDVAETIGSNLLEAQQQCKSFDPRGTA